MCFWWGAQPPTPPIPGRPPASVEHGVGMFKFWNFDFWGFLVMVNGVGMFKFWIFDIFGISMGSNCG